MLPAPTAAKLQVLVQIISERIGRCLERTGKLVRDDELELFSLIVKTGSFAAAARENNSDPSTVSRTIASLEEELGIRLFQRSTRQLVLSEAGDVYYQRMAPLLEEINHARSAASDLSTRVTGRLRITASHSFGLKVVVPRLPEFSTRHPDLSIELLLTDAVVDLLAERVDLAIRLGPLSDSTLAGC